MLIEHSDGTLEYVPESLLALLAEAEENEARGTFWYTCPYCKYTTNVIYEVYKHKAEDCQSKHCCDICYILDIDLSHYMWHGYECLEDGIQTMRAKLRPHRSTPYKPPQRIFAKNEEGKAMAASSSSTPYKPPQRISVKKEEGKAKASSSKKSSSAGASSSSKSKK